MPLLGRNGLGDTSYWCFVATIEKNDRKLGFSEPFWHKKSIRISFLYKSYVLKWIKKMSISCRDIWGLSNAVICCHCLRKDVFQNVSHIFRDSGWSLKPHAGGPWFARARQRKFEKTGLRRLKKGAPFRFSSKLCFVVIRSFNHSNNNVVE